MNSDEDAPLQKLADETSKILKKSEDDKIEFMLDHSNVKPLYIEPSPAKNEGLDPYFEIFERMW